MGSADESLVDLIEIEVKFTARFRRPCVLQVTKSDRFYWPVFKGWLNERNSHANASVAARQLTALESD